MLFKRQSPKIDTRRQIATITVYPKNPSKLIRKIDLTKHGTVREYDDPKKWKLNRELASLALNAHLDETKHVDIYLPTVIWD